MVAFSYIAIDKNGKEKKGLIESDTARMARAQLREQALLPVEVNSVREDKLDKSSRNESNRLNRFHRIFRKKVSDRDLSLITRQMSTLLAAAMPVDEMLTVVAEQTDEYHIKSVLLGVRAKVVEGYSLADSMGEFPKAFPKLYRTTVSTGEKSGKLDQVLDRLADYTERQQAMKQKIQQALIYPIVMTVVSISVVVFLLIYVVPKIIDVFRQTKQTLPMATQILLKISHFLVAHGVVLIVVSFIILVIFLFLLKKKKVRFKFHAFLLKLPIIGKTIVTINTARFGRTLGILCEATVPILEAMQAASELITPLPIYESVQTAIDQVRQGISINHALKKTRYFSPMFVHLVAVGEKTGTLEKMLVKASEQQENDVKVMTTNVLTLFEPAMILIMGGIVLFIVLAVMLPIFSLDQFPT